MFENILSKRSTKSTKSSRDSQITHTSSAFCATRKYLMPKIGKKNHTSLAWVSSKPER